MLYSGRNEHRGEGQRRVVNTFDIVVVAVVGGLTFLGLWKGMVKQLVALAGVVAGYMIAMRFYGPASRFLTSFHPGTAKVICFVAIFVACILCAHILGWAAGKLFGISGLGFLNRIGRIRKGLCHRLPCSNCIHRLSSGEQQSFQGLINHQIYSAGCGNNEEHHPRRC
jgi:hypothetical protein